MITVYPKRGMSYDIEQLRHLTQDELGLLLTHEYGHLIAMKVDPVVRSQIRAALIAVAAGRPCPPLVGPDPKDEEIAELQGLLKRALPFVTADLHHPVRYETSRELSVDIERALNARKS